VKYIRFRIIIDNMVSLYLSNECNGSYAKAFISYLYNILLIYYLFCTFITIILMLQKCIKRECAFKEIQTFLFAIDNVRN